MHWSHRTHTGGEYWEHWEYACGELQPEAGSVLETLGSFWGSYQDPDLMVGHAGVILVPFWDPA